jgi:hypothetical protein
MPKNMIQRTQKKKTPVKNVRTHSEDGIDLTLIRWMLSLTPAQRLQVLQQNASSLTRLRHAKTHA